MKHVVVLGFLSLSAIAAGCRSGDDDSMEGEFDAASPGARGADASHPDATGMDAQALDGSLGLPPDAARDAAALDDRQFIQSFRANARAALAANGTSGRNCLVFPPAAVAAGSSSAEAIMRALVATRYGVPETQLERHDHVVCSPSGPSCSGRFQFGVASGGGDHWRALGPIAFEFEARATAGESAMWTTTDETTERATCIAGTIAGTLDGMCVLQDLVTCPNDL